MIKKAVSKIRRLINKRKIKYLIWDFDGTLYQNQQLGEGLELAYLNFLNKHVSNKKSLTWFRKQTSNGNSWGQVISNQTNTSQIKVLDGAEKNFNKSKFLKPNKKLVNKIEQLQNFKHIILSNSRSSEVEKCLIKIGFRPQENLPPYPFVKIFGRDNSLQLKPSLEAFKLVLDYTKENPKKHLMIGDSYQDDVEPAKRMGLQATLVWNLKDHISW